MIKDELETEKSSNLEKIKAEEQAIEEMERIFKHAKFEKKINISRLEKANREINKMILQLTVEVVKDNEGNIIQRPY